MKPRITRAACGVGWYVKSAMGEAWTMIFGEACEIAKLWSKMPTEAR